MNTPCTLSQLMVEVMTTKRSRTLTREETDRFHRDFEAAITDTAENLREEKRRAYEKAKGIVIR